MVDKKVDFNKISNNNFYIQFVRWKEESEAVMYYIELICKDDNNYCVNFKERYSELEKVHQKFKKESKSSNLPTFPGKQMFGNTDPKFLNQRLDSLQIYFRTILGDKDLCKLKCVKDWIYNLFKNYYKPPEPVIKSEQERGVSPVVNVPQVHKNNIQEVMKQCNQIVDNYSKQFIDLNEEAQQNTLDPEEERVKEAKYSQVLNTIKQGKFFDLPKGNDKNYDLLGLEEKIEVKQERSKLHDKLKNVISKKVILDASKVICPILNN